MQAKLAHFFHEDGECGNIEHQLCLNEICAGLNFLSQAVRAEFNRTGKRRLGCTDEKARLLAFHRFSTLKRVLITHRSHHANHLDRIEVEDIL